MMDKNLIKKFFILNRIKRSLKIYDFILFILYYMVSLFYNQEVF